MTQRASTWHKDLYGQTPRDVITASRAGDAPFTNTLSLLDRPLTMSGPPPSCRDGSPSSRPLSAVSSQASFSGKSRKMPPRPFSASLSQLSRRSAANLHSRGALELGRSGLQRPCSASATTLCGRNSESSSAVAVSTARIRPHSAKPHSEFEAANERERAMQSEREEAAARAAEEALEQARRIAAHRLVERARR